MQLTAAAAAPAVVFTGPMGSDRLIAGKGHTIFAGYDQINFIENLVFPV